MGFYFDSTYLILLPAILISMYAQIKINSTYGQYRRIQSAQGFSGAEVARRILDANGLSDVQIQRVSGSLTDHYDPSKRVVRLSGEIHDGSSIASISVAAHECGHAIQHSQGYAPLKIRGAIFPVVKFGSYLSWIFIFGGLLFDLFNLAMIGIIFFSFSVIFQLVTLPVEFNASRRALAQLETLGLATESDRYGAKKMLSAAALTYVAAALAAIAQLLRLLAIFGRRNDR